jgi:phosphate transport system protein
VRGFQKGQFLEEGSLMSEVRHRFHEEMREIEETVQRIGAEAQGLLEKALQALADGDVRLCDDVIAGDDVVDRLYLDIERRIISLFALQTPVASDLRLLTALLHINLHLERIADQAVNLAKIAKLTTGLPQIPNVLQRLEEMGAIALRMVAAAMDALARRDLDLARQLPGMDDPIDRLNRGMLQEVLEGSVDRRVLEWGIRIRRVLDRGAVAAGFDNDLWTLARVTQVIEQVTGVAHHPGHVWRILTAMRWSLQRPTRQAVERDEAAIARWVAEEWPGIVQTPERAKPGSASSTSRASS